MGQVEEGCDTLLGSMVEWFAFRYVVEWWSFCDDVLEWDFERLFGLVR